MGDENCGKVGEVHAAQVSIPNLKKIKSNQNIIIYFKTIPGINFHYVTPHLVTPLLNKMSEAKMSKVHTPPMDECY